MSDSFKKIDAESDSTLRHYQQQAVRDILDAWRKAGSVMLQMPTGTGKTRLFVSLINSIRQSGAAKGDEPRFLIVTHREELVAQVSETLTGHYQLQHGVLQGENTRGLDSDIIVASIQTLTARMRGDRFFLSPWREAGGETFIIIDEAHHSVAKTYTELWETFPQAYKLGVTATPYRMGKGTFTAHYGHLILSQPIRHFIRQGWLADYSLYTVSRRQATIQQVNRLTKVNAARDYQVSDLQRILATDKGIAFLHDCYKRHCQGKRGIIYAVNRAHAEMIARRFKEQGVDIAAIDSRTPANRRKALVEGFRKGSPQVLVNVEIFGEGFDCPAIEFAMLARPTKSLAVYMQQTGRALRVNPDKKEEGTVAMILDCVGLHNRFGLPEDERDWDRMFTGKKLSSELYDRPLGEEDEAEGLIEAKRGKAYTVEERTSERKRVTTYETFTRNGLCGIRHHNGMEVVPPVYHSLSITADGWFHGRTTRDELVIFDKDGKLVFKMKNCDVQINKDGTFNIIATSPKGTKYRLGCFNKNMYIQTENVKETTFRNTTLYIQKDLRIVMLGKRLSLENMFFQNVCLAKGNKLQTIFIDLFGRVYQKEYGLKPLHSAIKPTLYSEADIRKRVIDSINGIKPLTNTYL